MKPALQKKVYHRRSQVDCILTSLIDAYSFLQTIRIIVFCKILKIADLACHSRHFKLSKRNCKDITYKSKSSLCFVAYSHRATFDDYRKYTLWLRLRDSRAEDQVVNCNLYCQ